MTAARAVVRRDATSLWLGRSGLLLDVALALWCAFWLWMAWAVADDVRGLRHLSQTVASVGEATRQTGQAIESLGDLPVVGGDVGEAGAAIERAGDDALRSAAAARRSVRRTSLLLGFSIAVIPTLPLMLLYVPRRIGALREQRLVVVSLRNGTDPALQRLLAFRALSTLPLHRLRGVSPDPVEDLSGARFRVLADAELARLGIAPAEARQRERGR